MRFGKLSVAALVACSVIACSNKSEPSAKQVLPEAAPVAGANQFADVVARLAALHPIDQGKIVSDTPDNAVKSWWEEGVPNFV